MIKIIKLKIGWCHVCGKVIIIDASCDPHLACRKDLKYVHFDELTFTDEYIKKMLAKGER